MYVRTNMTPNPITISYDATIGDARMIMQEKKVHRIPVMKDGRLVGLITDGNIQRATPNHVSSISTDELARILSAASVADYMTTDIVTIEPNVLLEECVARMKRNMVSCLPVIEDGKLIGIITETDLFDAFTDLLGFQRYGSRITIDIANDKCGVIHEISGLCVMQGLSIENLAIYREPDMPIQIVLRINSVKIDALLDELKNHNFVVSHVLKNERH